MLLREIPQVDEMVKILTSEETFKNTPRMVITDAARTAADGFRKRLLAGENFAGKEELITAVFVKCRSIIVDGQKTKLRPVINATGVVLHTNLGRAVISQSAITALEKIARGYSNLELNLNSGERGSRYSHVEELILKLTGAESCLVVNNNASAVLLALSALAKDKEVIVSRGQLVEIGGSFRIPEVMEQSGAKLIEVGSTNKTYAKDYEDGISPGTALLLKVHTSNYKISGFTHTTSGKELKDLGKKHNIPVMEDIGSGCLISLAPFGIQDEPTVSEVLSDGVDIVTFSGDKLLGGPQAGIIVGKKEYIELMKKHPLNRALRIDKFTIAVLEATLREYLDLPKALQNVPTLEMLTRSTDKLRIQARNLTNMLRKALGEKALITVRAGFSEAGGGALPTVNLPTWLVRVHPKDYKIDLLAQKLRMEEPAILARIQDDGLLLDVRTILYSEEYRVITAKLQKLIVGGAE